MKEFSGKLLNGMSIGVVVALIPNPLLGEILKLLIPYFPPLQHLFDITVLKPIQKPSLNCFSSWVYCFQDY